MFHLFEPGGLPKMAPVNGEGLTEHRAAKNDFTKFIQSREASGLRRRLIYSAQPNVTE